jgi:hypothetical protein
VKDSHDNNTNVFHMSKNKGDFVCNDTYSLVDNESEKQDFINSLYSSCFAENSD